MLWLYTAWKGSRRWGLLLSFMLFWYYLHEFYDLRQKMSTLYISFNGFFGVTGNASNASCLQVWNATIPSRTAKFNEGRSVLNFALKCEMQQHCCMCWPKRRAKIKLEENCKRLHGSMLNFKLEMKTAEGTHTYKHSPSQTHSQTRKRYNISQI